MTAYRKCGNTTLCVITATHRTAPHGEAEFDGCSRYLMYSSQKTRNQQRVGKISFHFISLRRVYRCCDGFFPLVLRRSCRSPPADSAAHLVVFFLTDTPIVSEPPVGFHSDWLPSRHLLTRWCMYVCMYDYWLLVVHVWYVRIPRRTYSEWMSSLSSW